MKTDAKGIKLFYVRYWTTSWWSYDRHLVVGVVKVYTGENPDDIKQCCERIIGEPFLVWEPFSFM